MNLVSNIQQLDFYNTPSDWDCYCEYLAYPSDLVLQDYINTNASTSFDLKVYVMSADGITTYEDATSYFSWYVFTVGGYRLYNLRLNSYADSMCENLCWILRIEITIGGVLKYRKWTNRYCQTECCDVPRGITFETGGFSEDQLTTTETIPVPVGQCGSPLIRIEVDFPCVDFQLGEYYGLPTNILQGSATFSFKKITNISGKVLQKPRDITRTISFNCTLQRSESFKVYNLQSEGISGTFPKWKLNEFEGMFHAPVILISDFYESRSYQFQGGTIAIVPHECWEIYRLNTTLQSCTVRQTFGCSDNCETINSLTFLIPESYAGGDFFTESQQTIGNYDNLLEYYQAFGEVVEVSYPNTYEAFTVTGSGYIPTNFYYDYTSPRSRVFGTNNPIAPVVACAKPVIGTPETYEMTCQTPTLGTEETYEVSGVANIANILDWVVESDSKVDLSTRWGRMNLETSNSLIIETSPLTMLANEPIGKIEANGAPSVAQTFTNSDNPSIPIDSYLVIDTNGLISYSGYPTSYTGEVATITITDLYYLL